jgi:hypothetical protein
MMVLKFMAASLGAIVMFGFAAVRATRGEFFAWVDFAVCMWWAHVAIQTFKKGQHDGA